MMIASTIAARGRWAPAVARFRSLADPAGLACLRECGLVASRPEGRAPVRYLDQPALSELFEAAETLLRVTGDAVAPCPSYRDQA